MRAFSEKRHLSPARRCKIVSRLLADENGFTLIEIILVIIMTGLLAMLFSQTLISSIQIYTDFNVRKTAHIDVRRSFDMLMHDIREWESWYGGQSASEVNFNKYNKFQYLDEDYYSTLRVGYLFSETQMSHRRNEDGSWNNYYLLLESGVVLGATNFSTQNPGGVTRISAEITMTLLNKPLRMRTTIFPRNQGG